MKTPLKQLLMLGLYMYQYSYIRRYEVRMVITRKTDELSTYPVYERHIGRDTGCPENGVDAQRRNFACDIPNACAIRLL